eukprot:Nitzschia sp. Nitz4//scaffold3_size479765//31760//32920//NITZ4_000012-RA/size479765-processed-gene-0.41-mRNA-1//1//CDS//3329550494//4566//frame0
MKVIRFSKKRLSTMSESAQISTITQHLEWTSKQGHCLTADGRALELYTPERGFPFSENELPHYHLIKGDTHQTFAKWKKSQPPASLVAGSWDRPLFCGGWNHTTNADERVYNVQTHNLFIDMRIPRTRELVLPNTVQSLEELTPEQLRLYARQHVFAGFSVPSREDGRDLCTRHHCIDWNFVGQGRPRPNKWWIHMDSDRRQWLESSYATDERGQYYYFERWQRRAGDDLPIRLALRKAKGQGRDGVVVVVGDHFNYVFARELTGGESDFGQSSLVDLVDAAVAAGDLASARGYLSIEAGHGTVSSGWMLDCAIPLWNEGSKRLFPPCAEIRVVGGTIDSCQVEWDGDLWDVLDCSFASPGQLQHFLLSSMSATQCPFRPKIQSSL